MNNLLIEYLFEQNTKINQYISNLKTEHINNKLFQKKIEYIDFYFKTILNEFEELNYINQNNLYTNDNYINNEFNKYINIENTINNQFLQFI